MSSENEYLVPDVWAWDEESGGTFGSINRPVAGAIFDKALPLESIRFNCILREPQTA